MSLSRRSSIAAALLLLGAAAWCDPAGAVEIGIFTHDGFVAFSVEDHWSVISMQTKPPIAVAIFQIPNPADAGTPDSTNLSVTVFDLDSAAARAALEQVAERIGPGEPKVEAFAEWTVIRQEGKVGATAYSVVDAKRRLTESAVAVRIAWPHLPGNPADYDHQMETLLRRVLASSYEHIGPYEPREGERILRPLE